MNEFGSLLRNRQNFISKTRINKCFFSSNNDDSSKPLNEAQKRRRWLDVSIVLKNSGRAFDADKELVPISSAVTFPNLKCTDLHGRDKIFPNDWSAQVKLVTLSFKESGGTMLAGWSDPFREHFSSSSSSVSTSPSQTSTALQLMMVEYAMLSVAKSWFIKGATTTIPAANHANTCFVFGGVKVSFYLFTSSYLYDYSCCTILTTHTNILSLLYIIHT